MKITAEFNSNEELISFIGSFGPKTIIQEPIASTPKASTKKNEVVVKIEDKTPIVEAELVTKVQTTEKTPVEDTKPKTGVGQPVTLEVVRAKLAVISQAGKQTQVKALLAKFDSKKLTDVSAERYKELVEEAEKL